MDEIPINQHDLPYPDRANPTLPRDNYPAPCGQPHSANPPSLRRKLYAAISIISSSQNNPCTSWTRHKCRCTWSPIAQFCPGSQCQGSRVSNSIYCNDLVTELRGLFCRLAGLEHETQKMEMKTKDFYEST